MYSSEGSGIPSQKGFGQTGMVFPQLEEIRSIVRYQWCLGMSRFSPLLKLEVFKLHLMMCRPHARLGL